MLGAGVGAAVEVQAEVGDVVAEALVELLRPIQERLALYRADPGEVFAALEVGAAKAREVAEPTLERARAAIGLTALGALS